MDKEKNEIMDIEIDEKKLLKVDDYYTGNPKFMSEDLRKEESEEGKMIGTGTIINHEYNYCNRFMNISFRIYLEGNIIIDYNNYKDPRMNFYIPRLHDK